MAWVFALQALTFHGGRPVNASLNAAALNTLIICCLADLYCLVHSDVEYVFDDGPSPAQCLRGH